MMMMAFVCESIAKHNDANSIQPHAERCVCECILDSDFGDQGRWLRMQINLMAASAIVCCGNDHCHRCVFVTMLGGIVLLRVFGTCHSFNDKISKNMMPAKCVCVCDVISEHGRCTTQ